jgi:hypothetical protein
LPKIVNSTSPRNGGVDHIEKFLDLSLNSNLQTIHIILPDFVGCQRRIQAAKCHALTGFVYILSQIRSPSLREVILSEGPEMDQGLIDIALLPAVVSVLKGKQFAQMQRVVFPPLGGGLYKSAKDYLKTALSEWDDEV